MSLWRDELKASSSTLACLIVLACIALGSLSRVIDAPGYLGWAIAATVIGAAFAAYFGQRSLGVGFVLLIVFALATLPALFTRGTSSAALLPTPDAFATVRKVISAGFRGIAESTPPVPSVARFTILIWLSFLLLGFLGAAWVVVRRPVGAVVSALAVVTFTGSVGGGSGRAVYAVAAVAATGAFFLAEGRHRIARWGGGRVTIPAWLGIPTLAAGCLVAIAAPIVLGDTPIVKLQSAIRPRLVIIKPLSDIRRQLKIDPPVEVMRVTSADPTYWRLTGLDAYDGREWVLEARPRDLREGIIPPPDPATTGDVLVQQYRLTSLLAPWLPAAYAAAGIETDADVQIDEGSQTLLLRSEQQSGFSYTVRSRLPKVSVNSPAEPKEVDDVRAELFGDKARSLIGDARTPLDIARALEKHFHSYAYDENVPSGHTVARLEQFLADRKGYCEQFAATMTLMLRGLGIDARVGVGFLPGVAQGGEYVVSTKDAHAWVEVDLPGAGWFAFDPTPGRADAASIPPSTEEVPPQPPEALPEVTAVPAPTPIPEELPENVTEPTVVSRLPAIVGWSLLVLAIIGAIPGAKAFRRSRRRRGTPDEVVVGAYTELLDRARDLGRRPSSAETQREFVTRVLRGDEHATALAWLTARALYGPGRSERGDAAAAIAAGTAATSALRRRSPKWRRVLAIWDPRSFLPERPLRQIRLRVASALSR